VLFEFGPDLRPLLNLLRDRFGTTAFTIEDAARFVLIETPFRDDAHLKEPTLKPAEQAGQLDARKADGSKRRAGTYPPGTMLRFRDGATKPDQRS
jgi:hypothetical protein